MAKQEQNPVGLWSGVATLGLLAYVAIQTCGLQQVVAELRHFVSWAPYARPQEETPLLLMLSQLSGVVVCELACTITIGVLVFMCYGSSQKHAIGDLLEQMTEGNHFFTFFIIVLVEELFARWLFLGVLRRLPGFSGENFFWAFLILGNGLWALVHLFNYKRESDRKVARVLPQFVAGIFYSYAYLKWGLFASILAHFASNAVLFATHKVQRVNQTDGAIILYNVACGALCYWLMRRSPYDVLVWLHDGQTFQIPGWVFWDYVLLSLFFGCGATIVFGVLLCDYQKRGKPAAKEPTLVAILIAASAMIGILYGVYWLLGFVVDSTPHRVLALTILLSFIQKTESGSALSRSFWSGVPNIFITVCVIQALGFWLSVCYVAIEVALSLPVKAILESDE